MSVHQTNKPYRRQVPRSVGMGFYVLNKMFFFSMRAFTILKIFNADCHLWSSFWGCLYENNIFYDYNRYNLICQIE